MTEAPPRTAAKKVYTINAKCTECELCIPVCPTNAIFIGVGQMVIDVDQCNGCGICPAICPERAIHIKE